MPAIEPARASVDVRCTDASEFLSCLDPLLGLFTSDTFIFRGVASREHWLLPSAHRTEARLKFQAVPGPAPYVHLQCAAEFHTLDRFFAIASRNGIRIPEDAYVLREELDDWRVRFQQNEPAILKELKFWPSAPLFSLIALAQHFGDPTRALDWTWSAHVAAYFAARSELDKPQSDWIAVWAIDDSTRQMDRLLDIATERTLRVFTVSGADNENLRAQRGLFMLHPQALDGTAHKFIPKEYNEFLRESLLKLKGAAQFIRVLVAASEAPKVLSLLAHAGITRGALNPGLWGVAREYEDEQNLPPSFRMPMTLDMKAVWDQIQKAQERHQTN